MSRMAARLAIPVALIAAFGLTACGSDGSTEPTAAASATGQAAPSTTGALSPEEEAAVTFAQDLTAKQLPEAEAVAAIEAAGFSWRVVEVDGEAKPATMDYRPDRMNLTVTGGVVTLVTMG